MSGWVSVVKDVVLLLIALYGAALSTFNWRQAIKRDRRAIKVDLGTAILTYQNGSLGQPFAQMRVTNIGQRPVTVASMFLEIAGGARLFSMMPSAFQGVPDTPLPVTLKDGESATHYMSYQEIGEALISSGRRSETEIALVCEDSSGGTYRSESWTVDPDEFRSRGLQ